jgi:hypothetical protein
MNLCPFGDETLTTFLTAALDEVTPGFGRHTGTKSVLVFAGALRGLIGPFHLFRLKVLPGPKSSLEGRKDKCGTKIVNGTSAMDAFARLAGAVRPPGLLFESLQLTDSVLDQLLIDCPGGTVIDVDYFGIALELDRVESVRRHV